MLVDLNPRENPWNNSSSHTYVLQMLSDESHRWITRAWGMPASVSAIGQSQFVGNHANAVYNNLGTYAWRH